MDSFERADSSRSRFRKSQVKQHFRKKLAPICLVRTVDILLQDIFNHLNYTFNLAVCLRVARWSFPPRYTIGAQQLCEVSFKFCPIVCTDDTWHTIPTNNFAFDPVSEVLRSLARTLKHFHPLAKTVYSYRQNTVSVLICWQRWNQINRPDLERSSSFISWV